MWLAKGSYLRPSYLAAMAGLESRAGESYGAERVFEALREHGRPAEPPKVIPHKPLNSPWPTQGVRSAA